MIDQLGVSLGTRHVATGVVLVDRSCGVCPSCAAGASLWCVRPDGEERDLTTEVSAERGNALSAALTAASAFVEAPATSTVLVLGEQGGPLSVLVRALSSAHVLVGPDPFDHALKAKLASLEPTGRATVIVAGSDARAAVKAVRRGGYVCVGDPSARMPSVTELVQREVTLVGPRSVTALIGRVGDHVWNATVAAAD